MKPTRARELVVIGVIGVVLVYVLLIWTYRSLPRLPRTGPLSIFVIGLLELETANITRHRMAGRAGTKPIAAITVARLAALAKASSLTGALLAGCWAALLIYTAVHWNQFATAGADLVTASLGLAASAILTAGALLLERVCRVRKR